MKYPSHIILDIATKAAQPTELNWSRSYARAYNLKLITSRAMRRLPLLGARAYLFPVSPFSHNRKAQDAFVPLKLFDVHFLRKERLYTKLKYSRCPQYDIVSGGFAALLAGFIGFLISEKFGIELVDSGDFYVAFMYGVFISFSLLPLIRVYSKNSAPYSPISLKYLAIFLRDLLTLIIRFLVHQVCLLRSITSGFIDLIKRKII